MEDAPVFKKMGFLELQNRINTAISTIKAQRERDCMIIARDALSAITSRMQNQGIDADGQKMGDGEGPTPYSDRVVPYWFFKNKPSNRGNAVEDLYSKKGYFASYADWREVHGLPTDKVTTTFTGSMWHDMKPVIVESTPLRTVIEFQPSSEENKMKYFYLNKQYGIITRLSEQEKKDVRKDNESRLNKYMNAL